MARATSRTGSQPSTLGRAAGDTTSKRWSRRVTETSNALDLEEGVFTKLSARQIALSLKRSAEHSQRRKADPFRSAMSMLTFYMNRAGKNLPIERRRVLNDAKDELRRVFDRNPQGRGRAAQD